MNHKLDKSTDNPLKKSWVTLKQDVKKLQRVAPNNKLDFYALENFDLTGPCNPEDFSYEMCKYNEEAWELENGVDIKYFRQYVHSTDYTKEFKTLIGLTETLGHKAMMAAPSSETLGLNRYPHIIPYEYNKVCLCNPSHIHDPAKPPSSDCYINASFISSIVKDDNRAFIATQGPLDKTIHSFWKMVHQLDVNLIIMLCSLKETTRVQCERYWPPDCNTDLVFDDLKVQMIKQEELCKDVIKRIFMVEDLTELKKHAMDAKNGIGNGHIPEFGLTNKRLVMQIHFTGWPDHVTPKRDHPGMNVLIEAINSEHQYSRKPIVIHCSGGIGRSGTLITIYNLFLYFRSLGKWVKFHNASMDEIAMKYRRISIFSIIRRLRQQRWSMVLSPTQYQFIYQFVLYMLEKNEELHPILFGKSAGK